MSKNEDLEPVQVHSFFELITQTPVSRVATDSVVDLEKREKQAKKKDTSTQSLVFMYYGQLLKWVDL